MLAIDSIEAVQSDDQIEHYNLPETCIKNLECNENLGEYDIRCMESCGVYGLTAVLS